MNLTTVDLHNYTLEKAVLSSFIFDPASIEINLDPDIFFHTYHKEIYLGLVHFIKNEKPVDEELLQKYLVKKVGLQEGEINDVLLSVLSANPIANISAYIEPLVELKRKRDVKTAILNLNQSLMEDKDIEELEASFLNYSEKIVAQSSTELFTITPASRVEEKEAEFITKSFIPIPRKTVSIFSAGGGTGKTSLLLQLSMHYLYENPTKKAFCWLSEDPLGLTKYRLNRIIGGLFQKGMETLHRLMLSDDLTFPVLLEQNRVLTINALFYKMKTLLRDYDLIILDPLIAFFGGDENNNSHAKLFMQLFTKWAGESDKTIIFIHHSTKNTSQSRGASAFTDAARAVYEIEKIKDDEGKEKDTTFRRVTLTKDNYRGSAWFGGFSKDIQVFSSNESPQLREKEGVRNLISMHTGLEDEHIGSGEEDEEDELGIR